MSTAFRRLLALLALLTLASLAPPAPPPALAAEAALVPLPGGCGDASPPGGSGATCCISGYVWFDGRPVAGARVTLSAPGQAPLVTWTSEGADDDPAPFYRRSLSEPPLSLQPGAVLTVRAEYAGRTATVTHTVIADGQQVDLVIPGGATAGFQVAGQIFTPTAEGVINTARDVAVDSAGNAYVADYLNHRVQVFNASGQLVRAWGRLGGGPGEFVRPSSIYVDGAGSVYVANEFGARVQRFTNTGDWLATYLPPAPRTFGSRGLAILGKDADGKLYVADSPNHRVLVYGADGQLASIWGVAGDGPGQLDYPSGGVVTPGGEIFLVNRGSHRVGRFSLTGQPLGGWLNQGSAPGQLDQPTDLALGADGNLYITEWTNSRLQRFSTGGQPLGVVAGPGWEDGLVSTPNGVAAGPTGVYVADTYNHRVQRFSTAGVAQGAYGACFCDMPAGLFFGAQGLTVDGAGNLYVADTGNHRLVKLAPDGRELLDIGLEGWPGDRPREFSFPMRVALDGAGNIYVSEAGNGRVQKLAPDGSHLLFIGSGGDGPTQLSSPEGVAVDGAGNLYVADAGNGRVQQYAPDGRHLRSFTGQGAQGPLINPEGVAVDGAGNVYTVETLGHRVRKFASDGRQLLAWGTFGGEDGRLFYPHDLTFAPDGSLYISDEYRVQQFSAAGQWLASFGTAGSGPGELNRAEGLAVGPGGAVYVADADNNRVQIFRPTAFSRPVATVVVARPRTVARGGPVTLVGMGADSDDSPAIAAYEWRLRGAAAPFAAGPAATLDTSGLEPGIHTVVLTVTDGEGERSDPVEVAIEVTPPPPQASWTLMLYLAGDNRATDAYFNTSSPLGALYRLANSAGSSAVRVAAFYDGEGAGNSFYYLFEPGRPARAEAKGELNSGDPQTLIDFVGWARQVAPASRTYLAIADHANGLDGIAWDFTSDPQRNERLTNQELRAALSALTDGGLKPFDVLHLDGCLMGLLENAYQVRGMARYLVASENLGWSAFAYSRYRAAIGPQTTPDELARWIVSIYAGLLEPTGLPYTIAALDMAHTQAATDAADGLADALLAAVLDPALSPAEGAARRELLLGRRDQAQRLDSNGDISLDIADEYVDLDHLAELVGAGLGPDVTAAAATLRGRLEDLVLTERSASGAYRDISVSLTNARGVAIYYPRQPGPRAYETYRANLEFAADTSWDELLQVSLAALPITAGGGPPQPVAPQPFETPFVREYRVGLPLIR